MEDRMNDNNRKRPADAKQQTQDQPTQDQPTRWYCDTDCRAANRPCRGEKGKDPTAKNLCPYYEDMLF